SQLKTQATEIQQQQESERSVALSLEEVKENLKMDWLLSSATNAFNVFLSFWMPKGNHTQKLHLCITEVIDLMTPHEIPNMKSKKSSNHCKDT
ncbi:hypothetical protein QQF64_019942, partial [Cirrhinus molitorella]